MPTDQAQCALRDFLLPRMQDGAILDEVVRATLDAMDRATRPQTPRKELAVKAKRLSAAASEMLRVWEQVDDLKHYLRNSRTLSEGRGWGPDTLAESREFDALTYHLRSALRLIEQSANRLTNRNVNEPVLVREGRPENEDRTGLGFELAWLYSYSTGKKPTISGEATIDEPITDFGSFVALAAPLSPYGLRIRDNFAKFIRLARSSYLDGAGSSQK